MTTILEVTDLSAQLITLLILIKLLTITLKKQ